METKTEPYTQKWERKADKLARSFAPPIYPCKKCGNPVIQGYCCTFCKDANP